MLDRARIYQEQRIEHVVQKGFGCTGLSQTSLELALAVSEWQLYNPGRFRSILRATFI